MSRDLATKEGGLLCVLLVRFRSMSADSGVPILLRDKRMRSGGDNSDARVCGYHRADALCDYHAGFHDPAAGCRRRCPVWKLLQAIRPGLVIDGPAAL
jgi:hypothetical protein